MKTSGVSCETKFGLLVFLGHPNGELGVSDNCLLPICKGGTKKEKALLVRACACDCPLEAKNLIETTFCEC